MRAPQYDDRIVLTLDAGGTNCRFAAMRGGRSVTETIALPSNGDDFQQCVADLVSRVYLRKISYRPLLLACDANLNSHLVAAPNIELLSGHAFRVNGAGCSFDTVYRLMDTADKMDPLFGKGMIFTAALAGYPQEAQALPAKQ